MWKSMYMTVLQNNSLYRRYQFIKYHCTDSGTLRETSLCVVIMPPYTTAISTCLQYNFTTVGNVTYSFQGNTFFTNSRGLSNIQMCYFYRKVLVLWTWIYYLNGGKCTHVVQGLQISEEGKFIGRCLIPCGCWNANLEFPQNNQVLFTAETSLRPNVVLLTLTEVMFHLTLGQS